MKTGTRLVLSVLAAGICCLLLTGCDGNENSPQGVLQMMGSAVRSGNLTDLQSCLEGDALKTYGTEEALSELRHQTSGMELSLGDAMLTGKQDPASQGITRETYDVAVMSRKAGSMGSFMKFVDAQVVCETSGAAQESVAKSAFFMIPSAQADTGKREPASLCRITELKQG